MSEAVTPTEWFDQFPPLEEGSPEFKPPELGPRDVQQLRQALEADGYLCCKLGDQRMYELWGRWGPEAADA